MGDGIAHKVPVVRAPGWMVLSRGGWKGLSAVDLHCSVYTQRKSQRFTLGSCRTFHALQVPRDSFSSPNVPGSAAEPGTFGDERKTLDFSLSVHGGDVAVVQDGTGRTRESLETVTGGVFPAVCERG